MKIKYIYSFMEKLPMHSIVEEELIFLLLLSLLLFHSLKCQKRAV